VREGDVMWLRGMLADESGARVRTAERRFPWPASAAEAEDAGKELGAELVRG
jgi:hypothetical protein